MTICCGLTWKPQVVDNYVTFVYCVYWWPAACVRCRGKEALNGHLCSLEFPDNLGETSKKASLV